MKRIGLFGGTFDPIHFGHLRAALEIQETFDLDETCLIPSAVPPHKTRASVSDARDRLAMIRLALGEDPLFSVSDVELKRSGPSYTIHTVAQIKSTLPDEARLYLIVGMDAFVEIHTWKSYQTLFRQIPFIVVTRPSGKAESLTAAVETIGTCLRNGISRGYEFSADASVYRHALLQPVHVFRVTPMAISSTKIRGLVKTGRSIKFLLPPEVATYIDSRGLYR